MNRTIIVLDEQLILKGLKVTGIKTRRALVEHALRELLRRESHKKILKLKGKVQWKGDLEEMRKMRF